jgi:DNA-binding response OmpR family regulator
MTMNILIVDDELEICKVLKRYLEMESEYNVEYETDPVDALEKIKKGGFHIVLSDIMMPGLDGIELLREIKNVDGLVQVVMMTAFSTVEKVIACLEIGAADYIMKPFEDLSEVKEIIDQVATKLKRWRTVVVASQQLQRHNN